MNPGQPLAGKRILVTRARQQAGRLASMLQAQGADVLRLPTIEIWPPETFAHLDSLLHDIASFQWLIVTSVNGALALAGRLEFLRIPRKSLSHLQVAAIGPATAAALENIGLVVTARPDQYVAEAVLALLKDRVAGQRILLARARIGRDLLPEELRKCGADVHVAETYRTVVPAESIERLRQLFAPGTPLPDAVTFTSSSTVDNFFTLLIAANMAPPQGLAAVSIGPVTTRTLRGHRWEPAREAAEYNLGGLVAACVSLLARPGHD